MTSVSPPSVIGHRGASAVRAENTVEAFRHAAALGADWVELDVRRTAEGALTVHHDARLPDGRAIVDLLADALPASLPSLAQALDACGSMGVNIEIKNDRRDPDFDPDDHVARSVASLLAPDDEGRDLGRILVTSFNEATIAVVRDLAPAVATGLLVFDGSDPEAAVERAVTGGHVAVNPWDPFVDARFVALARSAGLQVNAWTIDDPERMRELVELGVDGIITNVPDVARVVVDGG